NFCTVEYTYNLLHLYLWLFMLGKEAGNGFEHIMTETKLAAGDIVVNLASHCGLGPGVEVLIISCGLVGVKTIIREHYSTLHKQIPDFPHIILFWVLSLTRTPG
ncbi:hypothetical protein ACJX0J_017212, partial [Zea mays]